MKFLFTIFIISGVIYCDVEANIDSGLPELNVPGLPGSLSNITDALPVEEAEKILKEKCLKNSGSELAYEKAKNASIDAQECVKKIVDFDTLNEEIEKNKKTGDLDLVFKKYCQKSPTIKECVFNLTKAYEPCLDKEEIETKETAINVTDSLVDFICFKDGDRIALFIAEGGPECINASSPGIKDCVEKVFNVKLEGEVASMENLPQLLLKTEECQKFTELQQCVVKELESCKETTPANVVDSLFGFIRRHTPCQSYEDEKQKKMAGSACSPTLSILTFLSALFLLSVH